MVQRHDVQETQPPASAAHDQPYLWPLAPLGSRLGSLGHPANRSDTAARRGPRATSVGRGGRAEIAPAGRSDGTPGAVSFAVSAGRSPFLVVWRAAVLLP